MTGEGLYHTVRSLTKQEKANFSRFVDARKGSKPNYYVLFERLVSCPVFNEKQIRGKEFKSSSKYYQNREILTDKLIQSLVYFNGSRASVKDYVLQAIRMNAPDFARKRMEIGMDEAISQGDWSHLERLHRLRVEIEEAYQVPLSVPPGVPDQAEVRKHLRSWEDLEDLLNNVRHHLRNHFGDHQFHVQKFRSQLEKLPILGERGVFLKAKIMVAMDLLKQDYAMATTSQEKVVQILGESKFPLKNPLLIKELSILVRLANQTQNDQVAFQNAINLRELDPQNPREADLKVQFQTKAQIAVATLQGNLALAKEGQQLVLEHMSLFKENEPPTYLMGCASVFFLHGEYRLVLETLTAIRSGKRSQWEALNWGVDLLRTLANYELGNFDVLTSLQRSLHRTAQSQPSDFPVFATRLVAKIINASSSKEANQVWQKSQDLYHTYWNDPKESVSTEVFDLSLWIEAKVSRLSTLEIFQNRRQKDSPHHKKAL